MPQIRPISDLRNNFSEISKIVHTTQEPIFLTKNGHGDMVVMSIEQYEMLEQNYKKEIALKLYEAELESKQSDLRYSHDNVFDTIKEIIK